MNGHDDDSLQDSSALDSAGQRHHQVRGLAGISSNSRYKASLFMLISIYPTRAAPPAVRAYCTGTGSRVLYAYGHVDV